MGLVLPEITEQSRRGHLTPLCLCFLICGMEVRLPALQGCSEGHRSCVPRSWHHTWDLAGLSKCGCFLPSLPPGLRGLICLVGMRFPCVFCRLRPLGGGAEVRKDEPSSRNSSERFLPYTFGNRHLPVRILQRVWGPNRSTFQFYLYVFLAK